MELKWHEMIIYNNLIIEIIYEVDNQILNLNTKSLQIIL